MKNAKLTDTRYLYLSAMIAVMEGSLIGSDMLDKMVDAGSYEESLRIAVDQFAKRGEVPAAEYETMLSFVLCRTYAEMEEALASSDGEKKLFYPLKLAYDCQNLKSCIKCERQKVSPEEMLLSCGNVPAALVPEAVAKRDFFLFSPHMAEIVPEVLERFAKTGDPETVDRLLDKAAFLDMEQAADAVGLPYLSQLCRYKTDLVNVMIFARCEKAKTDRHFLQEALLPGGSLDEDVFLKAYDNGTEAFLNRLSSSPEFDGLSVLEGSSFSLGQLEKRCDELYVRKAMTARMKSFGAEKPVMFMVEKENEIRNVRIVLAGKKASLSREVIRERIRVVS